jgi:hypothetical protein
VNGGELAAYSASKSAAWSLTNALRSELAPQKTQVLGLHMGYVDTDLTAASMCPSPAPRTSSAMRSTGSKPGQDEVLADEITQQESTAQGLPGGDHEARSFIPGDSCNASLTGSNVLPTRTITGRKRWQVRFAYKREVPLGTQSTSQVRNGEHPWCSSWATWPPCWTTGTRASSTASQQAPRDCFDNRGMGASSGSPRGVDGRMAATRSLSSRGWGFGPVDLFGFSMGGMISQDIVRKEPQLVRRMILTGTGPAGGDGISKVAG